MVFWSPLHWRFCQKTLYLVVRLFSQKSKIVIPYKIFKWKYFLRNSCSKVFTKFRINVSGEFHLQRGCRGQVFNYAEEQPFGAHLQPATSIKLWVPDALLFMDNIEHFINKTYQIIIYIKTYNIKAELTNREETAGW